MTVAVVASRTSTGIATVRPWTSYCLLISPPWLSSRTLQCGLQQLVEHRRREPGQRGRSGVGVDPVRRPRAVRVQDPIDECGEVGRVAGPLLLLRDALAGGEQHAPVVLGLGGQPFEPVHDRG